MFFGLLGVGGLARKHFRINNFVYQTGNKTNGIHFVQSHILFSFHTTGNACLGRSEWNGRDGESVGGREDSAPHRPAALHV